MTSLPQKMTESAWPLGFSVTTSHIRVLAQLGSDGPLPEPHGG